MTKHKAKNNHFSKFHEYLKQTDQVRFNESIKAICRELSIDRTTFYRRVKNPQSLSPADKRAIAEIYGMPVSFVFPETETE